MGCTDDGTGRPAVLDPNGAERMTLDRSNLRLVVLAIYLSIFIFSTIFNSVR